MRREKKIPLVLQDSVEGQHLAKEMKLSRKQIYWISQITGWSFFVGINLFIISSFEEVTWQRIISLDISWSARNTLHTYSSLNN